MLYPHNKEPKLSREIFQNPGREYRGAPFWAWNCQLEEKELLWQLEVLKKMGMGGAHMHVRTGMATPYLSDEHMKLVKACVEKCRQENMLAWLYDEDRWPSGAAGGLVTKEPGFRARHLLLTTEPIAPDAKPAAVSPFNGAGGRSKMAKLLCCYDIVLDAQGCLAGYDRIAEDAAPKGTKWYAYLDVALPTSWYNNQTYVDTLNPKALQKFIEVTYERYWKTCGEDFGGVVPAIFTDEPQFAPKRALKFARESSDVIMPWTDDLPETFREATGIDLLQEFPQVVWELPEGKPSQVRYYFHDHVCQRFTEAFADQCGAWCGAHGLMLTGHVLEEDTLESQTRALGEAMRSYRSFQLPGVDMLCNWKNYNTVKQAQSAAHQYGREGVLSELYGVTGWDYDFRGHKFQGDWQAALGVTVRVHHLSWVSMKGEAKRDYPASIHYQSPWWEDYSYVEDHFARVNTAMTRGKPLVRVGVIHPIESFWLHYGNQEQTYAYREQLEAQFKSLSDWLLFGSIDFDFISESLLPELCKEGGAPLQVGQMAYDAIVVPGCETLRSTTLERLEAFAAAGGRLIFLGDAPNYENAVPTDRGKKLWEGRNAALSKQAVLAALEPVRMLELRLNTGKMPEDILHQLRRDGEDLWLFLAHGTEPATYDITKPAEYRIKVKGQYYAELYDTLSGEISAVEAAWENGKTVVTATLHELDSLLLRFTPQPVGVPKQPAAPCQKELFVPALVDYVLSEPNVLLLDKAEFALDDAAYRPEMELLRADSLLRTELGWPMQRGSVAQPWVIPEEPCTHSVRLRFSVDSRMEVPDVKLALEDAHLAQITFNGRAVTAKPDGWFTDKCIQTVALGTLPAGKSTIEVVLPFGKRTNVEWCYLLGQFAVQMFGENRVLTELPEKLGFGDVTAQGLPYYGGNITYLVDVRSDGSPLKIRIPHYRGAGVRIEVAEQKHYAVYPPAKTRLQLSPGKHTLRITLLGHRFNCFGPVHMAKLSETWLGPGTWRTAGDAWTESYRLRPLGIMSRPWISI